ncbi:conserved hypothetical protein [Ricinus communis]|uniref:Uncharacterized protein n=1 Tax=Ricinus communis TaxID=3988 RepID=B9TCQ5_RICCO|nr:conserved hypothetical protein [Ricinus communis]
MLRSPPWAPGAHVCARRPDRASADQERRRRSGAAAASSSRAALRSERRNRPRPPKASVRMQMNRQKPAQHVAGVVEDHGDTDHEGNEDDPARDAIAAHAEQARAEAEAGTHHHAVEQQVEAAAHEDQPQEELARSSARTASTVHCVLRPVFCCDGDNNTRLSGHIASVPDGKATVGLPLGVGDRLAKVRHPVGAPTDDLRARVAVRVVQRIALDLAIVPRVVDQHVGLAVGSGRERVVARAPLAVPVAAPEHGLGQLGPRLRIEQVGVRRGADHAEAVVGVRRAGGERDEHAAVAHQHGRALVDGEFDFLPCVLRLRQQHGRALDRQRRVHFREIDVRTLAAVGRRLRPHEIALAAVLERGGVQRERLPPGLDLAALDPLAGERIGGRVLQHVQTDFPRMLGAAGREIDIPLAVDAVHFRRPDVRAHHAGGVLAPHGLCGRGAQVVERTGAADLDAVVFRHRRRVVIPAVRLQAHLRVGALLHERVVEYGFGGVGRGKCDGQAKCERRQGAYGQAKHRGSKKNAGWRR